MPVFPNIPVEPLKVSFVLDEPVLDKADEEPDAPGSKYPVLPSAVKPLEASDVPDSPVLDAVVDKDEPVELERPPPGEGKPVLEDW